MNNFDYIDPKIREKMCEPLLINSIKIMHHNVESLALQRRIIEVLGVPEQLDKYDTEITKYINEQTSKFSEMSMSELKRFMKEKTIDLSVQLEELKK